MANDIAKRDDKHMRDMSAQQKAHAFRMLDSAQVRARTREVIESSRQLLARSREPYVLRRDKS